MDFVEEVLLERSDELVVLLEGDAGLTSGQAKDLLRLAGPALSESWRCWHHRSGSDRMAARPGARELLSLIPGNSLASAAGLEPAEAWQGLRTVVPAIVEFGATRRRSTSPRTSAIP